MGCGWNMPGNYDAGTFEKCLSNSNEVCPLQYYPYVNYSPNAFFREISLWVFMTVLLSTRVMATLHHLTLLRRHHLAQLSLLWATVWRPAPLSALRPLLQL